MMLEGADDNGNDRDDDDDSDHHSNDGNSGDEVECSDNSEVYTNLMSDVDFPVDELNKMNKMPTVKMTAAAGKMKVKNYSLDLRKTEVMT